MVAQMCRGLLPYCLPFLLCRCGCFAELPHGRASYVGRAGGILQGGCWRAVQLEVCMLAGLSSQWGHAACGEARRIFLVGPPLQEWGHAALEEAPVSPPSTLRTASSASRTSSYSTKAKPGGLRATHTLLSVP